MQVDEFKRPGRHMSWGRLEAGKGDMLGLLHDLLLSGETSGVEICTTSMSHLSGQSVKPVFGRRKRATVQFRKCNCSATVVQPFVPSFSRCFPPLSAFIPGAIYLPWLYFHKTDNHAFQGSRGIDGMPPAHFQSSSGKCSTRCASELQAVFEADAGH